MNNRVFHQCSKYLSSLGLFLCIFVVALPASAQQEPAPQKAVPYTAFTLAAPENNATVRINVEPVNVELKLTPELQTDFKHEVQILMDNKLVKKGTGMQFSIPNVDRGTHTFSARVVDAKNKVLIRTGNITVHVHQPSRLN